MRAWTAQYIRPAQGQSGSTHLESNALAFQGAGPLRSIPKGLHLSAQGCEQRATLGQTNNNPINPERVVARASCWTGKNVIGAGGPAAVRVECAQAKHLTFSSNDRSRQRATDEANDIFTLCFAHPLIQTANSLCRAASSLTAQNGFATAHLWEQMIRHLSIGRNDYRTACKCHTQPVFPGSWLDSRSSQGFMTAR